VLEARLAIVHGAARLMEEKDIGIIMRSRVILYNMIVKDERDNYELAFNKNAVEGTAPDLIVNHDHDPCYMTYFQRSKVVRNPDTHANLQADLIEKYCNFFKNFEQLYFFS